MNEIVNRDRVSSPTESSRRVFPEAVSSRLQYVCKNEMIQKVQAAVTILSAIPSLLFPRSSKQVAT